METIMQALQTQPQLYTRALVTRVKLGTMHGKRTLDPVTVGSDRSNDTRLWFELQIPGVVEYAVTLW